MSLRVEAQFMLAKRGRQRKWIRIRLSMCLRALFMASGTPLVESWQSHFSWLLEENLHKKCLPDTMPVHQFRTGVQRVLSKTKLIIYVGRDEFLSL